MTSARLDQEQIRRLAEDVRTKILTDADLIARSEGEITIRVFRRGSQGFDIKLNVTT